MMKCPKRKVKTTGDSERGGGPGGTGLERQGRSWEAAGPGQQQ